MYNKGDLKITDPPCAEMEDEWNCEDSWEDGHNHAVRDARGKEPFSYPCAFLPHSCGEWVIGGPEQIRAMIEDLTEVLNAAPEGGEEG